MSASALVSTPEARVSGERAERPGWHRGADVALLALTILLTAATTVILLVPWVVPAVVNDRLDMAIITSATLVSGAVAALAWARGRVGGDGSALLRSSDAYDLLS